MDSNSLTKTKNWSGRNEVSETSGRLYLLWLQNKWLHMPRTTDYRHTRHNRWIRMELAFILAKNATRLNPFEIIPLQTTRKENNWKTEEALAWAAVTVEMEWSKGSNPWCLWWLWRIKLMFELWLLPSVALHLVGIFIYFSELNAGCLYAGVLLVAVIVSIYSLLVESWILYGALCYVMMLVMYWLWCKVEFIGNDHHKNFP